MNSSSKSIPHQIKSFCETIKLHMHKLTSKSIPRQTKSFCETIKYTKSILHQVKSFCEKGNSIQ